MTGRVVLLGLLGLLLICVAADAEKTPGPKKPSCPDVAVPACPLNLALVCGSDGNTYPNECNLCVERQETKKDILIVKEGPC